MPQQTKRTTIYLDPDLHKALKYKSVETSRSVSALINDAVRKTLKEDFEDNEAFEERVAEPVIEYDEMIRKLKNSGRL